MQAGCLYHHTMLSGQEIAPFDSSDRRANALMVNRTLCIAAALCGLVAVAARAADPVQDPYNLAQYDRVIDASDRQHWAYRPVVKPPVPNVRAAGWPANAIDRFILSRLETSRLRPNAPAPPQKLLRRIFLDVVGLPPTIQEHDNLLADRSADGWERLVDRLLADPGYGERWGRHWLDLVRYAETNGYERDAAKPHVWRYRDWVIDSLNADKPYDRFVLEQLAGDELPDASVESVIGTGFNRLGPWDDEPADVEEDHFDQLDDMVRTTSQAFLGLTLGCTRCHNHKFDALTAHDYYRMAAVFNTLKRPQNGRMELDLPAQPAVNASSGAVPRAYFLHEPTSRPAVTHLLLRGRASSPGPEVKPGVPAVLVAAQPRFPESTRRTSQRRLTFARWLVDERNPLTARVMVNRVWQTHFGQGIVRTSSDFGVMGLPPTHPELLDWLSHWFVHEANWSLKKLHRLILTSATYRMSKVVAAEGERADPENERFSRFPYRRLEVETIRDSMLFASGQLRRTMHGPSVHLAIQKEALAGSSDPATTWPAFDEPQAARRTVYAFVKRSIVVPMLEVLDLCDTTRSAERRNVTVVPTQALTLLNGDEVNRQSRRLADRLEREARADPRAQIDRAFRLTLARPPSDTEQSELLAFLSRESKTIENEAQSTGSPSAIERCRHEALVRLCRAIFNLNEFVYSD
jgi:hypothetical protein